MSTRILPAAVSSPLAGATRSGLWLPRGPVTATLWLADEEFPARCVITFDRTVHLHLPLDIIWALTQVLVQRLLDAVP